MNALDPTPFLRARKLLLVHLGVLGDAVHLTPALLALREMCAAAELHVVSTPVACDVLRLAVPEARFWPLERNPAKRSLRAQWRLLRGLRRERFDAAINLSAVDRSILITGLSGARHRLGHLGGREHFWNRWLIPHWAPRQPRLQTVYRQHLGALAAAGFPLAPRGLKLSPPAAETAWAAKHIPAGAAHFSLNASGPMKEWPLEHYLALARRLLQERPDLRIVISGTNAPREQARREAFRRELDDPRANVLPAPLSIAQLAAALARCRLHVGPDSGVVHLAAALGVPTVSLFRRRGHYDAWLPRGPRHRHFLGPCDCPDGRPEACRAFGQARCLKAIPPETVLPAALELLATPPAPAPPAG
jgi:ADP-heptose:LPS heptosyltransferase